MLLGLGLLLAATIYDAQAQEHASAETNRTNSRETPASPLLARVGPAPAAGVPLIPTARSHISMSGSRVAAAAGGNLPVLGSGTVGRLTKWAGIGGSESVIGDSTIFEDKFGKVGVGTDAPTSRLTVAGAIESTNGGIRFPDGTVQTSSAAGALGAVAHDMTLTGQGTSVSPLAVASPLMVVELDNPARQPVQASADCSTNVVGCRPVI